MTYWLATTFLCFIISGCTIIENVTGATSTSIPTLLFDCYRNNFTTAGTPNARPPLTVPVLVELLRKIELNKTHFFDMRMFATSLLHSVILDGVVRSPHSTQDDALAIPFRASGRQFNKYKLVVDYLTSGQKLLFPSDSLTTPELCFLHQMTSNTVDDLERGDESSTCRHQSSMPFNLETLGDSSAGTSECPIKMGVLKTKWGTVSAGHLIIGIASALQQSKATFARIEDAINKKQENNYGNNGTTTVSPTTKITKTTKNSNNVDNVWISTIAGDLAGVVLSQAVNSPELGIEGFWNDALLPRVHYLKSTTYDMTEADILGGIDALAISSYLMQDNSQATDMRLSQLIDMYYSERGLVGDGVKYKVSNRSAALQILLQQVNLDEQVAGAAKLLQGIGTYDTFLNENEIETLSRIVSGKFRQVAANITRTYDNIEYINRKLVKTALEIIVILDGSYDPYTARQMLYALCESLEVSYYSSKIGIVNGRTGNWISNVTGELFQLFSDLTRAENEWPSTLSLGRCLETIIHYYENRTREDCLLVAKRPIARLILILSPETRLTDNDVSKSQRLFATIKQAHPETGVVFVTSADNKDSLIPFTKNFKDNDHVLTPPKNVLSLVEHVSSTLSSVSGNIMNLDCNSKKYQVRFEDYITPNVESVYQIHHEYLRRGSITTKFRNSNYGDISICAYTQTTTDCRNVTVNGEITWDSKRLCIMGDESCNLRFNVTLNTSRVFCKEPDCRYPDQVRLQIDTSMSAGFVPHFRVDRASYIVIILLFSLYK